MVADTFSSTLGVILMGTGNDNNTWGNNCNTGVFQILEDSIANVYTSSSTGGTLDLSGSAPPLGPSQVRFWQLLFNGSLTANLIVKVPNLTKEWIVNNQCTLNGFFLQMQTPSGSLATIPQGWWRVWCDGGNNIKVWPQGELQNQMPNTSAAGPSYSSALETTGGFYRFGSEDWRIAVNATDVIQFTGPGATSPNLVNILSGSLAIGGFTGGLAPTGSEISFPGIFAPSGWYFSDGTAYSRTTDGPLFSAITGTSTANTHNNTTIDNLPFNPVGIGIEGAFIECAGASIGTTVISTSWNGSTGSVVASQTVTGTNTGTAIRFLPWGQGDGSTTFNVPDRRGRTLAGRDNMNDNAAGRLNLNTSQGVFGTSLGASGGEQSHTLITNELAVHNHTASSSDSGHTHTDGGHTHSASTSGTIPSQADGQYASGAPSGQASGSGSSITIGTGFANIQTGFANITTTVNNAGGGATHNNVQPTGITNIIIKR